MAKKQTYPSGDWLEYYGMDLYDEHSGLSVSDKLSSFTREHKKLSKRVSRVILCVVLLSLFATTIWYTTHL